jgi:hypothetical protein
LEGGEVNTGSAVAVHGELVGSPGGKQKVRANVQSSGQLSYCY